MKILKIIASIVIVLIAFSLLCIVFGLIDSNSIGHLILVILQIIFALMAIICFSDVVYVAIFKRNKHKT
jgi:hypothetical protein